MRKLKRFLPERLASVKVRLVTATAGGHVVVTQQIRGSGRPLAQTQKAPVDIEHIVIQQLVQDGCKRHRERVTNELLGVS